MDTSQFTKPLRVINRIQETPYAVSLILASPSEFKDKYKYEAGQFVSFFLKINGEEISRSYSLSSSPNVDEQFQVAVKKVPGGKASTYLCEQLQEGDILATTPPAGQFFKLKNQPIHYFLFASRSGVTPIFSILKIQPGQFPFVW